MKESITTSESEDNDVFERCMQKIKGLEPMDQDQERWLILEAKQWDQKAFEQLVLASLYLILSIAQQHKNHWVSLRLLINEWTLWVMKSIQEFDENNNIKFLHYTARRINQSILQFLEENSVIAKSLWWVVSKQSLDQILRNIWERHNKTPTKENIAKILKNYKIPS